MICTTIVLGIYLFLTKSLIGHCNKIKYRFLCEDICFRRFSKKYPTSLIKLIDKIISQN